MAAAASISANLFTARIYIRSELDRITCQPPAADLVEAVAGTPAAGCSSRLGVVNPEFDLVPVMSMTDPGTFALAQDILKRHGIPSFLRGEAQAWAFGHPALMPFHTEFGPVLLVEQRHAKTAMELLAGMSGTPRARRQRRTMNQSWLRWLAGRIRRREPR